MKEQRRRSPNLTPEARKVISERIKRQRECPEFEAKRMEGYRKGMAKKLADPEYRRELSERAREGLYNPKRWINYRKALAKLYTEEHRRKLSERMKGQRRDPEFIASMAAWRKTPEGKAKRSQASKKTWAKKRGFHIPPELKADYYNLVHNKKYTIQEAGQILGLI